MKNIIKYKNRKLYDTESSKYITLLDIEQFIKDDLSVKVIDHPTKNDITMITLLQVLFEVERRTGRLSLDELIAKIKN